MAARRRPNARIAALPVGRGVPELTRFLPSGRSVLVGLALLVLAAGAYVGAKETSVFALETVDVRGGTPALRAQVRAALAPTVGKSLLRIDGDTVNRALAPLPGVRSFTYDRSFPHTLRVVVRAELPVLVLRRVPGNEAYLIAASGRVLRPLTHAHLSHLPRLWVKKNVPVSVGDYLPAAAAAAANALGALRGAPLPGGVRVVQVGRNELTLVLGGGIEIRLGDVGDLRLKLAIARRILQSTGAAAAGTGYLDVSVPERPVLSSTSQVGG